MSTQDGSGVPFEICSEQQHLRLLELPPALLEQVTSKRLPELTLKSAPTNLLSQTTANAVLCTDNQTYQVRQVQSSNSIFILQPSECSFEADAVINQGLSAIAQCTATLELIPAQASAIIYLKHALSVYSEPESGTQSSIASAAVENRSKQSILADAPFSLGELDGACEELCIFEVDSTAWLPTATMLVSLWKSIMSAATLRSVDLGKPFSVATLNAIVEEDGHSSALFDVLMSRLGSNHGDSVEDYAVLSRTKVVLWVGATLLELQSPSTEGVLISAFLQEWRDCLPEAWRKDAILDILKGRYTDASKGRIVFNESGVKNTASSAPIKVDARNARKWHEKFKDARR